MAAREPLKGVGYWCPNRGWYAWRTGSDLPDPRWLVQRGWRRRERSRILAYLRSAPVHAAWCGYSYCRFWLCLTPRPRMGSCDLSDGEWLWPQGLAHYVERHSVCLPDEFVEAMRSNGWHPPPPAEPPTAGGGEIDYDLSFWVAWGRQRQKRPWYWLW
jgi:hypothetical protein